MRQENEKRIKRKIIRENDFSTEGKYCEDKHRNSMSGDLEVNPHVK